MLRGLPGINTRSVLVREYSLGEHLPKGRAHRDPSVHLLDVSTIHRLLARLQRHILHVIHLSYLNEMQQYICMNAKLRVVQRFRCYYFSFTIKLQSNKTQVKKTTISFSTHWAVIYRVVFRFTLLHKMNWDGGFYFGLTYLRLFNYFTSKVRNSFCNYKIYTGQYIRPANCNKNFR